MHFMHNESSSMMLSPHAWYSSPGSAPAFPAPTLAAMGKLLHGKGEFDSCGKFQVDSGPDNLLKLYFSLTLMCSVGS